MSASTEEADSVEVYASNKGSELLDDVYMNHADYIKLTVKNGDPQESTDICTPFTKQVVPGAGVISR